ncbi:MAG: potassium-transporting ATPase subunit KdpC [Dehalococcoidia bacterium]|jgi:K+-transporting ATPase ATPase C chain
MWRSTLTAIRLAALTLLIMGVLYPLAMTGFAHVVFPDKANGSLIKSGDQVIGSKYIGQTFTRPEYFHARPSAAGGGYDAMASGASNLGPTSADLMDRIRSSVAEVVAENPALEAGNIPADMVTASASGLDPDISPANAYAQVPRVAAARNLSQEEVRRLVDENTSGRDLGFLGERRVNVLELDLALDRLNEGQPQ